jgi:hypothetical protein
MALPDLVRQHAAHVAAHAQHVRIDLDALSRLDPGPMPELDPDAHWLDGPQDQVALGLLTLDAINFGSGWFPTLRKRRRLDGSTMSGYFTVAHGLADRFRASGPWTPRQLRELTADEVAATLGQPRDHELMALFAQALRQLGRWLGDRSVPDVVRETGSSAVGLAEALAAGMPMWDDTGFYKRAQIAGSDLELAGVALRDVDRLTIFADNLVPHVLRCEGVLVYDDALAAWIDEGRTLPMDAREREVRACAVHACVQLAQRLGTTERELDNALWARGQAPEYKARPRHRTRCVWY